MKKTVFAIIVATIMISSCSNNAAVGTYVGAQFGTILGSAIGGIIGVSAVIIHKELLIPILCFVFFMESVSVLLQVRVAKFGNKRGKKLRLFKRAPIHDAFRILPGQISPDVKVLLNWPKGCWLESKITTRFWIITILMAALAIITLKIR